MVFVICIHSFSGFRILFDLFEGGRGSQSPAGGETVQNWTLTNSEQLEGVLKSELLEIMKMK